MEDFTCLLATVRTQVADGISEVEDQYLCLLLIYGGSKGHDETHQLTVIIFETKSFRSNI